MPTIHTRRNTSLSDAQVTPLTNIYVWICPTLNCGGYYASPDFEPGDPKTTDMQERRGESGRVKSHPRIECPACRTRGVKVNRIPFVVTTMLPVSAATA